MLEAQDVLDMKVVIKGEMELSNTNLGAIQELTNAYIHQTLMEM